LVEKSLGQTGPDWEPSAHFRCSYRVIAMMLVAIEPVGGTYVSGRFAGSGGGK
jgi:hypothetical protein